MKSEHSVCSLAETALLTGLSVSYLRRHARRLGGTRIGKLGHWQFIPANVKSILFAKPRGSNCVDPRAYWSELVGRGEL